MTQEYLWFLIQETLAFNLMEPRCPRPERVQVVSATGEPIPVRGWYKTQVYHSLAVVCTLTAPVIVGIDILQAHGLVLHFTRTPVQVTTHPAPEKGGVGDTLKPILETMWKKMAKICNLGTNGEVSVDAIDDYLTRLTHIMTWLNPEPSLFCHSWIIPRAVTNITRPYHHCRNLFQQYEHT